MHLKKNRNSMKEILTCIFFALICRLGFGFDSNYPRNGESLIEFWPLNDLNSVGAENGRGSYDPMNSRRLESGPFSNSAMSVNTNGVLLFMGADSIDFPNFIETFTLSFYFYITSEGFEGGSNNVALFNIFDSSLNNQCLVCSIITPSSIKIKYYNGATTEEFVHSTTWTPSTWNFFAFTASNWSISIYHYEVTATVRVRQSC